MLRSAAILGLLAFSLHAQSAKLQFEVASVRPSASSARPVPPRGGPGTADPEYITYEGTPFPNLLLFAYDVQPDQIRGPDWTNRSADPAYGGARYDISAKIPPGATRQQVAIMLQHLLEDRFQLTFHHETVQHSGLSLVVAKGGSKIKPSAGPATPSEEAQDGASVKLQVQKDGFPNLYPGRNQGGTIQERTVRMRFRDFPLSDLAQQLSIMLGTRIVDRTELNANFDFTLEFEVPPNARLVAIIATLPLVHGQKAPVEASGPDQGQQDSVPIISQALEQQLGLKLESTKVDVDTLVIDHIEKTPSEN